jgi:AcrR family transcriptional regulator
LLDFSSLIWHADLSYSDHSEPILFADGPLPITMPSETTSSKIMPSDSKEPLATVASDSTAEIEAKAPKKIATKKPKAVTDATSSKRRSFRGLSLEERQNERREKLIEAGLQIYGTQGFFSVTVRDICSEAKLTERYFYESFKRSEELFKTVYLRLIDQLQKNILHAIMQSKLTAPAEMVQSGLTGLFTSLQNDPRMARILFIDAILVHEMHGHAIYDTMASFDRMTRAFFTLLFPKENSTQLKLPLIATGLNGYVTHIATRWVMGGFKEPIEEVTAASALAYTSIIQYFETQNKQKI